MPFTRVGGISHVIGGGDCPRRHNSSTCVSGQITGNQHGGLRVAKEAGGKSQGEEAQGS